MKKVIMFEEKEFKGLFLEFVDKFIEQSQKGYGVSLYHNETNELLTKRSEIAGSLMIPWDEVFKKEEGR